MTLTCIGFLMYMLRAILIPFAVAMLLTYLIGPLVDLLTLPPLKCLDAREREKKYQNDNGNYTDVTGDETRIYSTQGKELLGLEDDDCCEPNIIGINLTTTNLNKDVHNAFKLDMRSKDNSNKKKLTGMNRADIEKSSTYRERMSSMISQSIRNGQSFGWRDVKLPRSIAIISALVIAAGLGFLLMLLIYQGFLTLEKEWPMYEKGAVKLVDSINAYLLKFQLSLNDDFVPFFMEKIKQWIPVFIENFTSFLGTGVLVLIFLCYMLSIPTKELPPGVFKEIDSHVRQYLRIKTFVCVIVGLMVGFFLYLLEIPYAWIFGVITFIFNYIPNFGAMISTSLPLPLVILHPTLPLISRILAFVLPSLAHIIVGNGIEPILFGEHLELHPIVILLSVAFWSLMWGIPGMILSVPLLAIVRIYCLHLDHPYAIFAVRILEGNLFSLREKADEEVNNYEKTNVDKEKYHPEKHLTE